MDKQILLETIRKIKAKKTVGGGAWRFAKRLAKSLVLGTLIGGVLDVDIDLPDIDPEAIAALGEDTLASLLEMSWGELDELEQKIESGLA